MSLDKDHKQHLTNINLQGIQAQGRGHGGREINLDLEVPVWMCSDRI